MASASTVDVAVLGGGPAGLAVAWYLAREGASVRLIERSDRLGGMAASIVVGGQRVDLGSHRLHPAASPEVHRDLDELLGADLQVRPRNGRLRIGGRWVRFPVEPGDLLRHLPHRLAVHLVADLVAGPVRRRRAPSTPAPSFDSELRRRLGATMVEEFYGPYARKLWGRAPTELSAELARRRVSAGSGGDLVRRLVRGARRRPQTFLYPRTGYGAIVEALAEAARAAGADIVTGTEVTGIELSPARPPVVAAGEGAVEARTVISTLPVTVLGRLLVPGPPESVLEATAGLSHRAMVLVYLVLDQDRYTAFDAHYLAGAETAVSRLSEPRNYRAGPDPAGRTVLCAEVPCDRGDEIWTSDDQALAARVVAELEAADLPPIHPVDVRTVRLPTVYPVFDRGADDALATVLAWLDGREGIVTLGRQGLFVPDNLHHVLGMARVGAACWSPTGFDRLRWHQERRAFDAHVVED